MWIRRSVFTSTTFKHIQHKKYAWNPTHSSLRVYVREVSPARCQECPYNCWASFSMLGSPKIFARCGKKSRKPTRLMGKKDLYYFSWGSFHIQFFLADPSIFSWPKRLAWGSCFALPWPQDGELSALSRLYQAINP